MDRRKCACLPNPKLRYQGDRRHPTSPDFGGQASSVRPTSSLPEWRQVLTTAHCCKWAGQPDMPGSVFPADSNFKERDEQATSWQLVKKSRSNAPYLFYITVTVRKCNSFFQPEQAAKAGKRAPRDHYQADPWNGRQSSEIGT